MAAIAVERHPDWDGFVPEWMAADGVVWLTRGARIYRATAGRGRPEPVAALPMPTWQRMVARHSLARRALRLSIYNLVPLPDGSLFLSFDKSLLRYHEGQWTALDGVERAFRILRGGCAISSEGDVFFGEYFGNPKRREPIHVYRLPLGSNRVERVFTFAAGESRHVHSVRRDPFSDDLWLCAGDLPLESRILRTANGFGTVETVGAGDESWRAISPVFTKESVFYATDAEFAANHIYRIHRRDGSRECVSEIDGPSYYGASLGASAVYATTVEMCPSQREPEAVLWAVRETGPAGELARYRKDLFALRSLIPYFQPGIVLFPSIEPTHKNEVLAVPFTGTGLKGLDGRMYVLSMDMGRP